MIKNELRDLVFKRLRAGDRNAYDIYYSTLDVYIVCLPRDMGGGPISAHFDEEDAQRIVTLNNTIKLTVKKVSLQGICTIGDIPVVEGVSWEEHTPAEK